jgi:hypothetical protein
MFAANGIGQGPALSLRLIGPRGVGLPDTPVPTPSDDRPASPPPSGLTRLHAGPLTVLRGVDGEMPGSNSAEYGPEPRPVVREMAARKPSPSPIGAPRRVGSGSLLGLGGDYIGRPAPDGPPGAPALSTSRAGGTASPADAGRPLQGIGSPSGSTGGHVSGRSVPRGDGSVERGTGPVAPDNGTAILDAGLEDLLGDGPSRPAGVGTGRSWEAFADCLEPGPPGIPSEGHRAEGSLPTEWAATGVGQEPARVEESRSVILPVSIGLAVSLAIRLRRRNSRILGRLRGWRPAQYPPSIPQHA